MDYCEEQTIKVKLDETTELITDHVPVGDITLDNNKDGTVTATLDQKTGNVYGGKYPTTFEVAGEDGIEPNVKPENIKKGVDIFGVEGTLAVQVEGVKTKTITQNTNGVPVQIRKDAPNSDGIEGADIFVDVHPELEEATAKSSAVQNGVIKDITQVVKPVEKEGLKSVTITAKPKQIPVQVNDADYESVKRVPLSYEAGELPTEVDIQVDIKEPKLVDKSVVVDTRGPQAPIIAKDEPGSPDGFSSVSIDVQVPEADIRPYSDSPVEIRTNGSTQTFSASDINADGISRIQIKTNVPIPEPKIQPDHTEVVTADGQTLHKAPEFDGMDAVTVELKYDKTLPQELALGQEYTPDPGTVGFEPKPIKVAGAPAPNVEDPKTVNITKQDQVIDPAPDKDGMKQVTTHLVYDKLPDVIELGGTYTPASNTVGFEPNPIVIPEAPAPDVEGPKTVDITTQNQVIKPAYGKVGMTKVTTHLVYDETLPAELQAGQTYTPAGGTVGYKGPIKVAAKEVKLTHVDDMVITRNTTEPIQVMRNPGTDGLDNFTISVNIPAPEITNIENFAEAITTNGTHTLTTPKNGMKSAQFVVAVPIPKKIETAVFTVDYSLEAGQLELPFNYYERDNMDHDPDAESMETAMVKMNIAKFPDKVKDGEVVNLPSGAAAFAGPITVHAEGGEKPCGQASFNHALDKNVWNGGSALFLDVSKADEYFDDSGHHIVTPPNPTAAKKVRLEIPFCPAHNFTLTKPAQWINLVDDYNTEHGTQFSIPQTNILVTAPLQTVPKITEGGFQTISLKDGNIGFIGDGPNGALQVDVPVAPVSDYDFLEELAKKDWSVKGKIPITLKSDKITEILGHAEREAGVFCSTMVPHESIFLVDMPNLRKMGPYSFSGGIVGGFNVRLRLVFTSPISLIDYNPNWLSPASYSDVYLTGDIKIESFDSNAYPPDTYALIFPNVTGTYGQFYAYSYENHKNMVFRLPERNKIPKTTVLFGQKSAASFEKNIFSVEFINDDQPYEYTSLTSRSGFVETNAYLKIMGNSFSGSYSGTFALTSKRKCLAANRIRSNDTIYVLDELVPEYAADPLWQDANIKPISQLVENGYTLSTKDNWTPPTV